MPSVVNDANGHPTLDVGDISILDLSDDELYQRLIENGMAAGPIVDSTRDLYRRKLYDILASPAAGNGDAPTRVSAAATNDTPTMERRRHKRNSIPPISSESYDRNNLETADEENIPSPVVPRNDSDPYADSPAIRSATPRVTVSQTPSALPLAVPNDDDLYQSFVSPVTDQSRYQSPFTPTVRKSMYSDGHSRSYTATPEFSSQSRSMVNRSTLSYRTEQPDGITTGIVKTEKSKKSLQTTIFEIFLVLFIVIVGYIFYREVEMYSAAEREFMDSQAPNMNVDQ